MIISIQLCNYWEYFLGVHQFNLWCAVHISIFINILQISESLDADFISRKSDPPIPKNIKPCNMIFQLSNLSFVPHHWIKLRFQKVASHRVSDSCKFRQKQHKIFIKLCAFWCWSSDELDDSSNDDGHLIVIFKKQSSAMWLVFQKFH